MSLAAPNEDGRVNRQEAEYRNSGLARCAGLIVASLLMLSMVVLNAPVSAQTAYRIGPGDVLEISIYGQPEISGRHVVRQNGDLVMHFLGPIRVQGKTLSEIEATVVEKATVQFQNAPSVVVGMAEYRDVYVLGDVNEPGVYPYIPGMTVTMALATAGGLRRASVNADAQAARLLGEQRQIQLSRVRISSLTAESEALEREIAAFQSGSAVAPDSGPLIQSRRRMLDAELSGLEQKVELAREEVDTLATTQTLIGERSANADTDLAEARTRSEGGYFPPERMKQLQTDADDLREATLEVMAAATRARRALADANNDAEVARSRYLVDLQSRLASVDAELALERITLQTSIDFVMQYGGPDALADTKDTAQALEVFRVQRRSDDDVEEIELSRTGALLPEDVLSVELIAPTE